METAPGEGRRFACLPFRTQAMVNFTSIVLWIALE